MTSLLAPRVEVTRMSIRAVVAIWVPRFACSDSRNATRSRGGWPARRGGEPASELQVTALASISVTVRMHVQPARGRRRQLVMPHADTVKDVLTPTWLASTYI